MDSCNMNQILGEKLRLSRTVEVLHRNSLYILVNKANWEWVKLTKEAYEIIKRCESVLPKKVITEACQQFREPTTSFESLLAILIEKGFISTAKKSMSEIEVADREPIKPKIASLAVTDRCNLHCAMCFAEARKMVGNDLLDLSQIRELLEKLKVFGCSSIMITGGEPMVREDIFEILSIARKNFSHVVLQTNGTLINRDKARRLAGVVDNVLVPLEGSRPSVHDSIRGKGTFDKAFSAIKHLRRAGIRTKIEFTATKLNVYDLLKTRALAISLGAEFVAGTYVITGRGRYVKDLLWIPPGEMPEGELSFDFDAESELDQQALEDLKKEEEREYRRLHTFTVRNRCRAITGRIAIYANGDVHPCEFLRDKSFNMGNLLQAETLEDIVFSNPVTKEVLSRTVDSVSPCKECDVRYFCRGSCMANAFDFTGSIWNLDPYCVGVKADLRRRLWENYYVTIT